MWAIQIYVNSNLCNWNLRNWNLRNWNLRNWNFGLNNRNDAKILRLRSCGVVRSVRNVAQL